MKTKTYLIIGALILILCTSWSAYTLGKNKSVIVNKNEETQSEMEKIISEIKQENQELKSSISRKNQEEITKPNNTSMKPNDTSNSVQSSSSEDFKKLEKYTMTSTKNYINLYRLYKLNLGKSNFGQYEKTRVITEFLLDYLEHDPSEALKWVNGEEAKSKIESYKKDVYKGPMSINQIRYFELGEELKFKDLSDLKTEAVTLRDKASVKEKAYGEVDNSKMYDIYTEHWVFELKKDLDTYKIINWSTKEDNP